MQLSSHKTVSSSGAAQFPSERIARVNPENGQLRFSSKIIKSAVRASQKKKRVERHPARSESAGQGVLQLVDVKIRVTIRGVSGDLTVTLSNVYGIPVKHSSQLQNGEVKKPHRRSPGLFSSSSSSESTPSARKTLSRLVASGLGPAPQ